MAVLAYRRPAGAPPLRRSAGDERAHGGVRRRI